MTATKLLRLKYLRAEKVLESIPQSITSMAVLKVIKEHNGIVVVGPNDIITQAEEYLQAIDKPVAQVLIEAIVVDYDRTKGLDLGVTAEYLGSKDTTTSFSRTDALIPGVNMMFSGPTLNNALSAIGATNLGKLPADFFLNLKAMEQRGIANVKSRPLLATLNGYPAMLSIGTMFISNSRLRLLFRKTKTRHTYPPANNLQQLKLTQNSRLLLMSVLTGRSLSK